MNLFVSELTISKNTKKLLPYSTILTISCVKKPCGKSVKILNLEDNLRNLINHCILNQSLISRALTKNQVLHLLLHNMLNHLSTKVKWSTHFPFQKRNQTETKGVHKTYQLNSWTIWVPTNLEKSGEKGRAGKTREKSGHLLHQPGIFKDETKYENSPFYLQVSGRSTLTTRHLLHSNPAHSLSKPESSSSKSDFSRSKLPYYAVKK